MRNTITNNGWNITEWGLGFLRVSSFPIDPSCTFETEEEFQNYLAGNDTDKPYLGQLVAVHTDKYHVYVILEYNGTEWIANPLNEDEINDLVELIKILKEQVDNDLEQLELKLKGEGLTQDYNTLAKIQDKLLLHQAIANLFYVNFLKELNDTQIGVGLSLDGSFSPDLETYYLKNATSVMNALKTLDALIHRISYQFESTDTVELETKEDLENNLTVVKANVKISPDSDIKETQEGLYSKVTSEYLNGVLTLKVNGEVRATHNINVSAIVKSARYDTITESFIFIFNLASGEEQQIIVPVADLITEWNIENPSDKVVELHKTRVVNGPDILTADVRISSKSDNILEKSGNSLYVKGTADNIKVGDSNVEAELNKKVNKALGAKEDYIASDYVNNPYYATDTKEILLNGENFGGGVQEIAQKIQPQNYTPLNADLYEVKSNTNTETLQLTFTPLSPLNLTVPETIGDITKGTTSESLKGKPISEILDSILFKTIYPTITDPSVTVSFNSATATVEAGSAMITNLSNNFNRGNVVVNDGVTTNKSYVGEATSVTYQVKVTGGAANNNAGVSAYPSSGDTAIDTVTRYEPGTYQYKVIINYAQGPTMTTSKGTSPNPMPTTNKGNVINPHPAGTVTSSYGVIRNVTLPLFVITPSGQYSKRTLKNWGPMTETGLSMLDTTKDKPIRILTPRKLQSVNSYNAVSGKYDVPQLSNFAVSETTEHVNGLDYPYYLYTWNGGALSAVLMEIKTY